MTQTDSKHILFLASWYPSRVHGTLGNFCQRHAQAIALKHKVTVVYLTIDASMANDYEITDSTIENVREIICYYKSRGTFGLNYFKAFNRVLQHLENKLETLDLVHVNVLYRAGLLALNLKKRFGLNYIITEHWTGYHNGTSVSSVQRYFTRRIAKRASMITPVSEHLAESMRAFGCENEYTVIPNVVDTELFSPSEERKSNFTFLHVSSLVDKHKNVSGIIRAFHEIHAGIEANLMIVGDGDYTSYHGLISELQIPEERIHISGEKSLAEVAQLMAESHCLILFSNYENQPCVIPESYSAGTPVIASDVGGIKEHLAAEQGILISKQNETELAHAMLTVYKNYNQYNPSELNEYARKHFSRLAIAKAYSKVYEQVI